MTDTTLPTIELLTLAKVTGGTPAGGALVSPYLPVLGRLPRVDADIPSRLEKPWSSNEGIR